MNISSISSLILKNYNNKFDEIEKKKCSNKKMNIKNLKINDLEIFKKNNDDNDNNLSDKYIKCNYSINNKKIKSLNFITDIGLVNKIIAYRELEIQKIIAILEYNIEIFKNIVVSINYITLRIPDNEARVQKLIEYNEYKIEVKSFIQRFIVANEAKLKEALDNYLFLSENMETFLKINQQHKKI
jgi:hypothetical protein